MILIQRQRTSQPAHFVGLAPKYKGNIVFAYSPSHKRRDSAYGHPLTQVNTVVPVPSITGVSEVSTGGANRFLVDSSPYIINPDENTMLAVVYPTAIASTNTSIIGYGNTGFSGQLGYLGQSATASELTYRFRSDTAVNFPLDSSAGAAAAAGWANQTWSTVVGTRSVQQNYRALYCNGKLIASNTCATVGTWTVNTATVMGLRRNTDDFGWLGRLALVVVFNRALLEHEIIELTENPWQIFEAEKIWVPVSVSGGSTYTFAVSGGITFSGAAPQIRERITVPSGGVTFSGTASQLRTRSLPSDGGVTFSGSAPIVNDNTYIINPSGGITFGGTATELREKVLAPTGGVTFGGSARLTFTPVGGVTTNDMDRISVGVARKVGVS